MKAKHRHELKTNELAEWINHAPQYLRENATMIIGVIIILIAIFTWPAVTKMRIRSEEKRNAEVTTVIEQLSRNKMTAIQSRMQNTGASGSLLAPAAALKTAASETKNPSLAALALIKQGEALRADLHYKAGSIDIETIRSNIAQARKAYQLAIKKAKGKPGQAQLTAMAKFGLGLCAEELGEFDKATKIYQQITADSQFEGTVVPAQAQMRLDTMPDNKTRFVFVDAPVPPPPPTTPSAGTELLPDAVEGVGTAVDAVGQAAQAVVDTVGAAVEKATETVGNILTEEEKKPDQKTEPEKTDSPAEKQPDKEAESSTEKEESGME
jgi:predicted negative regulator of RcsB-dependent stress response